jgi:hypothetical protein
VGITRGHSLGGVAQDFLQCLYVTRSHGEVTCKGMAQVFDSEIVYPCPSTYGLESSFDVLYPSTLSIHNNIL